MTYSKHTMNAKKQVKGVFEGYTKTRLDASGERGRVIQSRTEALLPQFFQAHNVPYFLSPRGKTTLPKLSLRTCAMAQ